jgi:hypothetical protein
MLKLIVLHVAMNNIYSRSFHLEDGRYNQLSWELTEHICENATRRWMLALIWKKIAEFSEPRH